MLHLIFQSLDRAILQRIENGDDVVFFEKSIFCINKSADFNDALYQMHQNRIDFYVLKVDIETRGVFLDELMVGVKSIDYTELVRLTEKNKVILTWN